MYKFDLILVVAGKDFQYMDVKLKNIREFINPDIVYIISPRIDIEKNKYRILKNNNKVFMIDENDILDINNINFNNVQIPGMPQRRFWYYQQFLKMAFSYSKYSTKDYYLIWDADTIPLNPIIFFENKKIHLTINKEEYNEQYHNNIARLFGDIKMHHKSFISQHLFVKKPVPNFIVFKQYLQFFLNV